jgi:tetratricopeptide (TPR) repeat protein
LLLWLVAVWLLSGVGCTKRSQTLASIRENYRKQDYEEAIVQCEYALRKDIRDGEVYYYYGLSLLALDRDYESFGHLRTAVTLDRELTGKASQELVTRGRESLERRDPGSAADRFKVAVELDPTVRLGVLEYLVADAYYQDKDFARAASLYRSAVATRGDTTAAEGAYFNLAACYVAMSDSARAVEVLEQQLELFPRGPLAGRASWKLVNLLYEHAQSEFARGNYDIVVEETTTLLKRTTNKSLVQKARFLLGEAYERMGEYQSAYEQYRAIIDEDRGASGRIVERARDKINAFRDSGLL